MVAGTVMAGGKDPRITLDDLFRLAAMAHPDTLAPLDPPNRETLTGGAPRALTYAQADRAIWAIAARLRDLGLPSDAVVALHLPNTVESVLTLLGILRAGMTAMPLPQLWRKADMVAVLTASSVKMLITCARIGTQRHDEICLEAAAGLFSVRYVAAYGSAADGVVPLDDVFDGRQPSILPATARSGDPVERSAIITWDSMPAGPIAVVRTHRQVIAGGLAVFLDGAIERGASILSTIPPTSFAGIAATLLPWLLSGGTLTLHHPFDAQTFDAQQTAMDFDTIVVPGAVADRLEHGKSRSVIALWRAPERFAGAAPVGDNRRRVDILTFGEIALAALPPGQPNSEIPCGEIGAPRSSATAIPILETVRSRAGTLAVRGPMVPLTGLPSQPDNDGFADTGFPCRHDVQCKTLTVTGPRAAMIAIGAYRFAETQLAALASLEERATLVAVPDALTGQRLVGSAPHAAAMQEMLAERGWNPLIVHAFRPRTRPVAA